MIIITKPNLKNKQIAQLNNIAETLIEATDHLTKHLNDRQFTQSINIYSSIVEGFQAIKKTFTTYLNTNDRVIKKIENNLIIIAEELEQNNILKITEIIQFSLMPNLRRLHELLSETETKKRVTIGIYYDKENPIDIYPEGRVIALNEEAKRQNTTLLYFSSKDINFQNKTIRAKTFADNTWKEVETEFPDVINNIGPSNKHEQSISERKLRRIIPFTSFHVGNKFHLPKIMVKHKQFANLLVPFKIVTDKQIVYDYLDKENVIVAKPVAGARGENIYFIRKKANRFTVTDNRNEHIYNPANFDTWLENTLLKQKFSYMVQRYINSRTKKKEPYDIRAHMQKNLNGEWQITKIYPRVGNKHSILSNISKGGRTQELTNFLVTEFGDKLGKSHKENLCNLSLDLTAYLDRLYSFSLDELGLDLAIDETGKTWLHEVNNGPQTTYHETERAVNTIGYAKFIAEKGIVKSKQFQMDEGQFNAKNSNLPFANPEEYYRIGMLKAKNSEEDKKLAVACAYVAYYENVQYYTFAPEDIDYNAMLIKGSFFENNKWVDKIVEYPNVIYDRLRLRGVNTFNNVYEELESIPFTNEFYGNSISKLDVYDRLKETGKLEEILIPYKKVVKAKDIFDYIDAFGSVIVKPEVGSFAKGVHYISKVDNTTYFMTEGDEEKDYTEINLRKYWNELINRGTFIVQQYIKSRTIDDNPFDIRVHLMKNGENEWDFVNIYPRIGLRYATIMIMNIGGYTGKIHGFLRRNYADNNTQTIINEIRSAALKITNLFSSVYKEAFNEIAFDFALDEKANLSMIELNVNKPGITTYEFELARLAIPNAIYTVKKCHNINFNITN